MLVKTKAIVLSAIKFQEKSLIVRCFTASEGLKSYFVQNAFSNSVKNRKPAYFQPLTLLEIEAQHKNKGNLEQIREIKIDIPFKTIYGSMTKSAMAMFLSEMMSAAIREEEHNEELFQFLSTAIQWLDEHEQNPNFHLIFLLEMTKYLGFYPDLSQKDAIFFDLKDGVFSMQQSLTTLTGHESGLIKKILALQFDSDLRIFHVSERQQLLKIIVDYYSLHLEGFRKPKSLEVFRELFSL